MENNSNKEGMKQQIRDHEGEVLNDQGDHVAYPGPKTKKLHIGYGHLLEQAQHPEELAAMGLEEELGDWTGFTITDAQAEALLEIDIHDAIEDLESSKKYPGWTEEELEALDPQRYIALISMAFQLGGFGVRSKFPSFVRAVKAEDWERAADEMLWSNGLKKERRSQWYKDTEKSGRCQEMADKMRYGSQPVSEMSPEKESPAEENVLEGFSSEALIEELYRRHVKKPNA